MCCGSQGPSQLFGNTSHLLTQAHLGPSLERGERERGQGPGCAKANWPIGSGVELTGWLV